MEQIFVAKTRICLCLFVFYSLLVDLLLIMADVDGTGKPNNCTDVLDAYLSIEGQKVDLNSTLCLVTLKENSKSQYSASFCIPHIYVEHTMRAYINEEQINSVTISECCYMDIEADNWTNALLVMQYSEDDGCLRSGTLNCTLTSGDHFNPAFGRGHSMLKLSSKLTHAFVLWPILCVLCKTHCLL